MTKFTIDETGEEVRVFALSFGYMYDIEVGVCEGDNLMVSLEDGTDLDSEGVRKLRRPEALAIWELIKKETYPELYDEMIKDCKLNPKEVLFFDCVGGGRCFSEDFQGNINKDPDDFIKRTAGKDLATKSMIQKANTQLITRLCINQ